jgi:hypothetical protein
VKGKSGRKAIGRRALAALALALAAFAFPAALAHAQAPPPVYDIPLPPPAPPQPTPGGGGEQSSQPRLMQPFPTVRTAGRFNRRRTRFTRIVVTAPAGATVRTRCRRLRCTQAREVGDRDRVRIKRLERSFKPRTVIEIRVTAPGVIGKHVELRIRRGRAPMRRDRCLTPGSSAPRSCPTE